MIPMSNSDARKRLNERANEDPTETVSESCPNHGCHDWRCESCKHPTREQVLADAEAGFINWYGADVGGPTSYTFKEAFIAGFLRGRGLDD